MAAQKTRGSLHRSVQLESGHANWSVKQVTLFRTFQRQSPSASPASNPFAVLSRTRASPSPGNRTSLFSSSAIECQIMKKWKMSERWRVFFSETFKEIDFTMWWCLGLFMQCVSFLQMTSCLASRCFYWNDSLCRLFNHQKWTTCRFWFWYVRTERYLRVVNDTLHY